MRWMQACANPLCLAPDCLRVVTHQRVMQLAAAAGRLKRSPVHRLKQLERMRNDPRVYPEWMVEWAIESPQNAREIAHALGVSWTTAKSWRNGTTRVDLAFGVRPERLRAAGYGAFAQLLHVAIDAARQDAAAAEAARDAMRVAVAAETARAYADASAAAEP